MGTYSFVSEINPVALAGSNIPLLVALHRAAFAVITGWAADLKAPTAKKSRPLPKRRRSNRLLACHLAGGKAV
jgi:hypothetical protein